MTEILNLSGMYDEYDLSAFRDHKIVDLKGVPGTRLYVDEEGERVIRSKINRDGRKIHLIDIGDYHYITRLYLGFIRHSFDLLVIDNHSDDKEPEFQGTKSCGSWIKDAYKEPDSFLSSVKLIRGDGSPVYLKGSFDGERPLYVSIDKDALDPHTCPCNWDQGGLGLTDLIGILSAETKGRKLLGADICGGITVLPFFSHKDILLNQKTDLALTDFFVSKGIFV